MPRRTATRVGSEPVFATAATHARSVSGTARRSESSLRTANSVTRGCGDAANRPRFITDTTGSTAYQSINSVSGSAGESSSRDSAAMR